jgi:hypothetical protein
MLQIDKHIPVPPDCTPDRDCRMKYPVCDMQIGDSVFFPVEVGIKAPSNAAQYYKQRGMKFTVRKVGGGGGCGDWRKKPAEWEAQR